MSAAANGLSPTARLLLVLAALAAGLAFMGKAGALIAAILGCALLGTPLFVLIGVVTVLCFLLWAGFDRLDQFSVLIERIRSLADNPALLAIPLFMASGAVMSRGQISARLVGFARALVGWLPGGLAISAVLACMLFASISGSSPATVVAIGAMMGPALLREGYQERFSHGLLTSAGSLGILIPPSIPMILYPIVNQKSFIEIERLFMAGVGPGLLIGGLFAVACIYRGLRDGTPRPPFSMSALWKATRDGFWALLFPVLVLGGIYSGVFNAVEAAGVSVVYAVVVEIWLHRALTLKGLPSVFHETGIFLGSLLVIMVAALAFNEFLEGQGVPQQAVAWIRSMDLPRWQFLVMLNLLLLLVGTIMDILSAMLVFVPLLAPIALSLGIDPIHFGIIFIVNLEIGYLTPPVGLNLFVASTLFERPLGHIIRSVTPLIVLMIAALGLITWFPAVSVGLGNWLLDGDSQEEAQETPAQPAAPAADEARSPTAPVMTLEEMMRKAEERQAAERAQPPGKVLTLEQMMKEAERRQAGDDIAGQAAPTSAPAVGKVLTLEEMRREAERRQPGTDDPQDGDDKPRAPGTVSP